MRIGPGRMPAVPSSNNFLLTKVRAFFRKRLKSVWLGCQNFRKPSSRNAWFGILVADCSGFLCAAAVWASALYVAFTMNTYVLIPQVGGLAMDIWTLMYNCVVFLLLISHSRCVCSNPGTATEHVHKDLHAAMRTRYEGLVEAMSPPHTIQRSPGWWCAKCDAYRPKRTHHCRVCRTCVLDMDHHCTWVNNCVGWRNHKYFVLFLFYAILGCTWSFCELICALWNVPDLTVPDAASDAFLTTGQRPSVVLHDLSGTRRHLVQWIQGKFGSLSDSPLPFLGCLLATAVSGIFLIFAGCMAHDQLDCLSSGYGAVDKALLHMASILPESKTKISPEPAKLGYDVISPDTYIGEISRVLGKKGPFKLWWLTPCSPGLREQYPVGDGSFRTASWKSDQDANSCSEVSECSETESFSDDE